MNKNFYILVGVGAVLVAVVLFIVVKMIGGGQNQPIPTPVGTPFPVATTTPGSPQGNSKQLATDDGKIIVTRDFLKDSETVSDTSNPGQYFLGNYIDPKNPNSTMFPYVIEYVESTNYFAIGLLSEPLGAVRKQAEQYLMARLNISQADMCRLRYTLSVPNRVNSFYAGASLGFSFCPGSMALPE
jgi:hypothetical protein